MPEHSDVKCVDSRYRKSEIFILPDEKCRLGNPTDLAINSTHTTSGHHREQKCVAKQLTRKGNVSMLVSSWQLLNYGYKQLTTTLSSVNCTHSCPSTCPPRCEYFTKLIYLPSHTSCISAKLTNQLPVNPSIQLIEGTPSPNSQFIVHALHDRSNMSKSLICSTILPALSSTRSS